MADGERHPPAVPGRWYPQSLGYVPGLDGIRALSALAVVYFHSGQLRVGGGFLGVDVFFVLSGFLITYLLLMERQATGKVDLLAFYVRRARRLLPALTAVAAAVVGVEAVGGGPQGFSGALVSAAAAIGYVGNWLLAARIAPMGLLVITWSLAVEAHFYLIWPLVVRLVRTRLGGKRTLFVGLVVVIVATPLLRAFAVGDLSRYLYFSSWARADEFAFGALASLAVWQRRSGAFQWPKGVLPVASVVGATVVLGSMLSLDLYDQRTYDFGLTAVAASSAAVIVAVVEGDRTLAWLLEQPVLRWIGKVSYSLYLWHYGVTYFVREAGVDHKAGSFAINVAVSLAIAAASYQWIERPWWRPRVRV